MAVVAEEVKESAKGGQATPGGALWEGVKDDTKKGCVHGRGKDIGGEGWPSQSISTRVRRPDQVAGFGNFKGKEKCIRKIVRLIGGRKKRLPQSSKGKVCLLLRLDSECCICCALLSLRDHIKKEGSNSGKISRPSNHSCYPKLNSFFCPSRLSIVPYCVRT